jgi:hypothetical protein
VTDNLTMLGVTKPITLTVNVDADRSAKGRAVAFVATGTHFGFVNFHGLALAAQRASEGGSHEVAPTMASTSFGLARITHFGFVNFHGLALAGPAGQ